MGSSVWFGCHRPYLKLFMHAAVNLTESAHSFLKTTTTFDQLYTSNLSCLFSIVDVVYLFKHCNGSSILKVFNFVSGVGENVESL